MPPNRITSLFSLILALALGVGSLHAQGVVLEQDATVLAGSAANCTRPATISYNDVRDATSEWQEIEGEGIRKSSARYALLIMRMNQRIAAAAQSVARNLGNDLVVVEGSISNPRGLDVENITELIIDKLNAMAPMP